MHNKIKKGVLVYEFKKTAPKRRIINIGDYVQSIAAMEIVGANEEDLIFVDRERLNTITDENLGSDEKVKVIMNGWYNHNRDSFPLDKRIIPMFTSIHGIGYEDWLTEGAIEDLKKWGPIGCRDIATVNDFQSKGIESYFSGCLTLSLPKYTGEKRGGIVFVLDNIKGIKSKEAYGKWFGSSFINEELLKNYTKEQIENATFLGQLSSEDLSISEQFKIARERLDLLSKAEIVVTTRIHTLMPSMAKGTKALLVMKDSEDTRFEGLKDFWNIIDFTEAFKKNKKIAPVFKINRDENNNIINNEGFREFIKPEVEKVKKFWNE